MKLKRIFIVNLLLIAVMLGFSAWAWIQLPPDAQIPTRFDFDGAPIAYMSKVGGLLLLPLVAMAIAVINLVLPATEPNRENIKRSQKAYGATAISGMLFLTLVHVLITLSALNKSIDTSDIIALALGIFFIVIGNYLSKIRRNYTFGFRTPWTLSSSLAWHKTHRWAGWLTVMHGLLLIIAGWQSNVSLLVFFLVSFAVVSIIILPVYSYFLWKSDPNRISE
ncbi:MAG: SdpI family protein [Pleurocapsa sp.]